MKDNFSANSDKYAKYRPAYPKEFYTFLKQLMPKAENVWDCGTGNGQIAEQLSTIYTNVFATDISQNQIDNAFQKPNIYYSVQPAEKTNFANDFFDLIVIAQAIHWFDFSKFYKEVKRTAKANALIIVIGYGRLRINEAINAILDDFYIKQIGRFWDKQRKFVDEDYKTIPFPFNEITVPAFTNKYEWSLEHLLGYLETWSAVKHYQKKYQLNPIKLVEDDLKKAWGNSVKHNIQFPILLRVGTIKKS